MNPRIFIPILTGFNSAGFRAAAFALKGLGSTMKMTAGDITKGVASMGAAFVGAELTKLIGDSVTQATQLQATTVGLGKTFEQYAGVMQQFSSNASSIGMNAAEANKALIAMGSTLRGSGFDVKSAADESQRLVKLGADMAYVFGYPVSDAVEAIGAMFRGEYDPIEKYGVALKQSQVDAMMAARSLNTLTGAAKTHAQQLIRVEMLYKATSRVTGAYADASNSLTVVTQNLTAEFKNIEAATGGPMLRPLTEMLRAVQDALLMVESKFVTFGQGIADIAASLQPLTISLVSLVAELVQIVGIIGSHTAPAFSLLSTVLGKLLDILNAVLTFLQPVIGLISTLGSDALVAYTILKLFLGLQTMMNAFSAGLKLIGVSFGVVKGEAFAATIAVDGFKVAMISSGIGALIVGLGMLAAYFVGEADKANQAKAAQDAFNGSLFNTINLLQDIARSEPYVAHSKNAKTQHTVGAFPLNPKPNETFTDYTLDSNGQAQWFTQTWTGKKWTDRKYMKYTAPTTPTNGGSAVAKTESAAHRRRRLAKEAMKQALKEYKDAVTQMYADIRSSIEGMFDVTQMGDSGARVINNMNKFLIKLRKFTQDVKDLAAKGLNPTALQAIIQAGPAGAGKLASSLASGGMGAIGQINAGYSEISSLGGQIATTAATQAFSKGGTQYNIVVNAGLGDKNTIGKSIVDAIAAYEKTSGKAWRQS